MSEELTGNQNIDRYKNRRKMAWLSYYFVVIYLLLIFFVPKESAGTMIKILPEILLFFGSVIGAYIGATIFGDKWRT